MNIKKYIFAGLLVWLPLAITLWVLSWLVGAMDGIFANVLYGLSSVLPLAVSESLQHLLQIRGLGVVLVFVVLISTGAFASNVAGRWLVNNGTNCSPTYLSSSPSTPASKKYLILCSRATETRFAKPCSSNTRVKALGRLHSKPAPRRARWLHT
jgi:hypothetical protein